MDCIICAENLFKGRGGGVALMCGHMLHLDCCQVLFGRSPSERLSTLSRCPNCKKPCFKGEIRRLIPQQSPKETLKQSREDRPEGLSVSAEGPSTSRGVRAKKLSMEYINLQEPPNGPSFHRERLEAEIRILTDFADEWSAVRASMVNLPADVCGEIDSTVGGIRLIVSSKFEQFRGLVEQCAARFRIPSGIPVRSKSSNTCRPNRPAKPSVTPEDLDGFWEMMNVHVNEIKKRIINLQALRENSWEPLHVETRQKTKPAASSAKPVKKPFGKSNFKEFLRRKKDAKNGNEGEASPAVSAIPDYLSGKGNNTIEEAMLPPPLQPLQGGIERHVSFVTNNFAEFATPLETSASPMPKPPLVPSREPSGAKMDLIGFDMVCSMPAVCSTPAVGRDSGNWSTTPSSTMVTPFDFLGMEEVLTPIMQPLNLNSGLGRDSFMTPRAAQNVMNATLSRRSSVGTIMHRALMGRVMVNMEEEADSLETFYSLSPCSTSKAPLSASKSSGNSSCP